MKYFFHNLRSHEFLRFCIVGAFCTGIDAALFYLFRSFTSYQISLVCGYIISLIVNYFLTIYWTFKTKSNVKNLIGVVSVHLLNLFVIRIGLMFIYVDLMSINDRIAYLPTLLISVVINYILVKFVVHKVR